MALRQFSPLELIEAHNANRSSMSAREFFGPKHQKLREWYCAAHFSLAYEEARAPCSVFFQEPDPGNHIDFYLRTPTGLHEFQIVEVQEPGRRRGDEYRMGGVLHADEDALLRSEREGPDWIGAAIDKKRRAYAGPLTNLHLLVYVNFWVHGLKYEDVIRGVASPDNDFASIWLLSGDAICCIKSAAKLGELAGWYKTPAATREA